MAKYGILKDNWALRGWTTHPKAVVNTKTGMFNPIIDRVDYVLRSCDGTTDFESPLFLGYHLQILETLEKQGLVSVTDTQSTIQEYQKYKKAECPVVNNVHWAVTGRCNLKCRHCYISAPGYKYKEPTFSQIEQTVKGFVEGNVLAVSVTGGEPFVRNDIYDIFSLLTENRIPMRQIFTNGLLVDEKVLNKLDDIGIHPEFNISFDGVGGHDYMRGVQGVEQKTLDKIRMLKSAGYAVNIATTIDRNTGHSLMATYELMKELGIKVWRVMSPYSTGDWKTRDSTTLSPDEELLLYSPVFKRWTEDGHPMVMQLGNLFDGRMEAFGGYKPPRAIKYKPQSYACDTCAYGTYLEPEGRLLPCLAYTDTPFAAEMPNVYEVGFVNAYNDARLRNICDMKRGDLFDKNSECADCGDFERCGVGCRAIAAQQNGDIHAKDEQMCLMFKNGYKEKIRR